MEIQQCKVLTKSIDSVLAIYPVADSETMVSKIPPKKDITKLEVLYTIFHINCVVYTIVRFTNINSAMPGWPFLDCR